MAVSGVGRGVELPPRNCGGVDRDSIQARQRPPSMMPREPPWPNPESWEAPSAWFNCDGGPWFQRQHSVQRDVGRAFSLWSTEVAGLELLYTGSQVRTEEGWPASRIFHKCRAEGGISVTSSRQGWGEGTDDWAPVGGDTAHT
jgi:hypothetical protein